MRGALILPAFAAILTGALSTPLTAVARKASADPVLVELFTAQGCASCPQANRTLGDVAERKGVLALTFPVDYWDYLGWRDTFAKPEFTDRQRAYVARLKVREIYTPEIVVEGRTEARGLDQDHIDALIRGAPERQGAAPSVRMSHGAARISVSPRPGGGAQDVWLIRYDPAERDVRVKSGDNKGKLVPQFNIVRALIHLGRVSGRARSFTVPTSDDAALRTVLLVQGIRGGPILAVRLLAEKPAPTASGAAKA